MLDSCNDRAVPMVNLGIDDSYIIYRMQALRLHSDLDADGYRWTCVAPDGARSVLSESSECLFLSGEEGQFNLSVELLDGESTFVHNFTVRVIHEEIEYSPYITKVFDYRPAPGQFINKMPYWETGDTEADMVRKVEECISGTADELVSLGAYGGYVTFGFDHTVINRPDEPDFLIRGNAFYETGFEERRAGSCEPGIVLVALDVNGNGVPDDEWYELAGSEYYSPKTKHNYSIKYHRPDPNRVMEEDETGFLNDIFYISWIDSEGIQGYIAKNTFHGQSYYPMWINEDEITFTGTCLASNGVDLSGTGRYFVLYSYDWGYVDNHPNDYSDLNSFDISWAVDKDGKPVNLPGVDFIRVYTGLNQYCGWLGETSTELSKARDLHIDLPGVPLPVIP